MKFKSKVVPLEQLDEYLDQMDQQGYEVQSIGVDLAHSGPVTFAFVVHKKGMVIGTFVAKEVS